MKLIYTANTRIPSEKAHPYQIVQMCEAFAAQGADVTLIYPARHNPPDLDTTDIWGHYHVARNFAAERLPCLDVYPLIGKVPRGLVRPTNLLAGALMLVSFHFSLLVRLMREREAILYSRNVETLALIAALWPRRARRAFCEAHTYPTSRTAERLRRWLIRRVGGVVTITGHLKERHAALGLPPEQILVAHDGIRQARFAIEGDQAHWRAHFGWPVDSFIVGYLGRFVSGLANMDKGIETLAEAVIALAEEGGDRPVRLALAGGPERFVEPVRARIAAAGLPEDFLLYPGMLPVDEVPGALRAFDVCTIPSPYNDFFAFYTSPMKLFEYMASGRPIAASDLPSTAEVLADGVNGLLVPPSDAEALADAIRRLRDDPALAEKLAAQAQMDVMQYTWEARAGKIMAFVASCPPEG